MGKPPSGSHERLAAPKVVDGFRVALRETRCSFASADGQRLKPCERGSLTRDWSRWGATLSLRPFLPTAQVALLFGGEGVNADAHALQLQARHFFVQFARDRMDIFGQLISVVR